MDTGLTALQLIEHGVLILDSSLAVTFVNRAFCRMWGLSEEQRTAYSYADLQRHGERFGIQTITFGDLPSYYVRHRGKPVQPGSRAPLHLRLADGRIIRVEDCPYGAGGRILTYLDETILVHAARQMEALATHDELTGLYNRRHFLSTGQNELERARRYRRPLSVVLLHPTHFDDVCDIYGRDTANEVLLAFAGCCVNNVRDSDHVGRLRGEEFAIVLIEAPHVAALHVAEKLCKKIAEAPVPTRHGPVQLEACFGVASVQEGVTQFSELLRQADVAFGPDRGSRAPNEYADTKNRRVYDTPLMSPGP